ncbi:MAG: tryptophan--tRNA ligase [Candidatus Thermoplasmatota archaeon]|nr:tryptophan--tRNA ligase [Candidatus Thermoplasmatota archaeon]
MIDPWTSSEIDDYKQTMKDFGISLFRLDKLPEDPVPPRLFREGIVFGERGFDPVLERMRSREPFAVMSGLMPSGRMHLGHKMVIDQMMYFQEFGCRVFIGIADLESYATRDVPLDRARDIAIGSYVKNYLALGLGRKGLEIYFQSKRLQVKDLALTLGRKVNLSTMRAIYGFNEQTNMAHMMAPLVQAGDILHPQLKLGPMPVVVPVGIDQDPHIRLCRDLSQSFRVFNVLSVPEGGLGIFVKPDSDVEGLLVLARERIAKLGYLEFKMIKSYKALYVRGATRSDTGRIDSELSYLEHELGHNGFISPSSTYHRFIRGLTGEKMSSSKPETAIFLDDDPDEACRKLKRALTGGRDTAEEQRVKGGDPGRCSVFETMLFHTVQDTAEIERISSECRSGQRLCGGCKKEACEHLSAFLADLAQKRDMNAHLVDEYVMED